MAEFLKQRAIIEDTYAKSMQKLSRSQDKYLDAGNIREAYLAVKGELATTGDLHSAFAASLTTKFEKRVMEFKDSQKVHFCTVAGVGMPRSPRHRVLDVAGMSSRARAMYVPTVYAHLWRPVTRAEQFVAVVLGLFLAMRCDAMRVWSCFLLPISSTGKPQSVREIDH